MKDFETVFFNSIERVGLPNFEESRFVLTELVSSKTLVDLEWELERTQPTLRGWKIVNAIQKSDFSAFIRLLLTVGFENGRKTSYWRKQLVRLVFSWKGRCFPPSHADEALIRAYASSSQTGQ